MAPGQIPEIGDVSAPSLTATFVDTSTSQDGGQDGGRVSSATFRVGLASQPQSAAMDLHPHKGEIPSSV